MNGKFGSNSDGAGDRTRSGTAVALTAVENELDGKVKVRMKDDDLNYGQALKAVARENPALVRMREQLIRDGAGDRTSSGITTALTAVENELEEKARARMKDDGLTYGQAFRAVAQENPALARTRQQLTQFLAR